MKTVVLGDPPPSLASLIAERKRLGLDRHDEVWQGEYHMASAASGRHGAAGAVIAALLAGRVGEHELVTTLEFNLGAPDDFRVPDLGVHRVDPNATWFDTAAVVVEIRSPDDETYDKFAFYADHGVDEILVVDLTDESVRWYRLDGQIYAEAGASTIINLTTSQVLDALGWPSRD